MQNDFKFTGFQKVQNSDREYPTTNPEILDSNFTARQQFHFHFL
jgi:hypothetical protein